MRLTYTQYCGLSATIFFASMGSADHFFWEFGKLLMGTIFVAAMFFDPGER